MKKLQYLLFIILFLKLDTTNAQSGSLDKTFGTGGKALSSIFLGNITSVQNVKVQPDGKILVLGTNYFDSSSFVVARFLANGTLDNTFSTDGYLMDNFGRKDNYGVELLLHTNSQITIIGRSAGADYKYDLAIARINSDGSYDNTFGNNGKLIKTLDSVEYNISAATLQSDNKIVVGGYKSKAGLTDFMVARINFNGSIDNNFGTNGKLIYGYSTLYCTLNSLCIDNNGRILAVGSSTRGAYDSDFAIARIKTDGTLDTDFSFDGKATVVFYNNEEQGASKVIVQKDGKILIGGYASYQTLFGAAIARINDNGTTDNSFSQDGLQTRRTNASVYINDMLIDSSGKIFVAGYYYQNSKARFISMSFNKDGSYNTYYGDSGIVLTNFDTLNNEYCYAMDIQSDNKILLAGFSTPNLSYGGQFALVRLLTNTNLGLLKLNKNNMELLVYPNPITKTITLKYALEVAEKITICFQGIDGKVIKTFYKDEYQTVGEHLIILDLPEQLANGNYLITISSTNGSTALKITK